MVGNYKYTGGAVIRTGKPRIDGINFRVTLTKDELETPLKGSYTYTGQETAGRFSYTHSDIVDNWSAIYVNVPDRATVKITKQEGNYVEWECGLIPVPGVTDNPDWGSIGVKIQLYATMKEARITEFVGSFRSTKYHRKECHYVKRIRYLRTLKEEEVAKRTPCKVCIGGD